MPSSLTLVHAAAFAVGAVVGGSVATALGTKHVPSTPTVQPANQVLFRKSWNMVTQVCMSIALHHFSMSTVFNRTNFRPVGTESVCRRIWSPTTTPCLGEFSLSFRLIAWITTFQHFKTAEHLTLASLGKSSSDGPSENGDRSKSNFVEDETLPAMFRAKLQDYYRSGFDRGHMVPAADAKSSQVCNLSSLPITFPNLVL